MMTKVAYLDATQLADRRLAPGRQPYLVASGFKEGSRVRLCVHSLSTAGAYGDARANLEVGDCLDISLPDIELVQSRIVWVQGNFFACKFEKPISKAVVDAVSLKGWPLPDGAMPRWLDENANQTLFPDAERWPKLLRAGILVGLTLGTWAVIALLF